MKKKITIQEAKERESYGFRTIVSLAIIFILIEIIKNPNWIDWVGLITFSFVGIKSALQLARFFRLK